MSINPENKVEFNEETLKTFASRVRELRQERELSLESLGKYLGYSRSYISMLEFAKRVPDIKILTAYSDFFDVPLDYLTGKTDVRKPLYKVACFTNITDADFGNLSDEAQNDIRKFIEYVMAKEKGSKK